MTFNEHTDAIYAIAVSPDFKYIASGSSDKSVIIWSALDGKRLHYYKLPEKIYHVEFNLDGGMLSVCGLEDNVSISRL